MTVDLRLVALEQQPIVFPRKIVAPKTLFAADNELGIFTLTLPGKRRRRVEPNSFLSEGQFAGFQNEQENYVTERSG